MNNLPLKQTNPLIDDCSAETLVNVQAMLARIQILRINKKTGKAHFNNNDTPCPGNELYLRLLILVKEALDYEINRVS